MKINGNLSFSPLGGEIRNAIVERLASLPLEDQVAGRIVFNTTDSTYYFYNGDSWVAFSTGSDATALQTEVDNIEAALGSFVNENGEFDPESLNALSNVSGLTSGDSLLSALQQLDAAITSGLSTTLDGLTDVDTTGADSGSVLFYDGTNWVDSAAPTNDGDMLQWNSTTGAWEVVASDTVGGNKFTQISGNEGALVADSGTTEIDIVGSTNGGISTTVDEDSLEISIDLNNIQAMSETVDVDDELIIGDTSALTLNKTSLSKIVGDLNIVSGVDTNGLVTRTDDGTYESREIVASTEPELAGISVAQGNGVEGNPVIGLNIAGLESTTPDANDYLVVADASNNNANSKITIGDLSALVSPAISLDDLTDVVSSGSYNDETAYLLVGNDNNELVVTEASIEQLSDVSLEEVSAGDILVRRDDAFVNESLEEAGIQPADETLTALAALDDTAGVVVQTGEDAFTKRTIQGTINNITVTNGDGVEGNPIIDLPDTGESVADAFVRITTDAKGRVTATSVVEPEDITDLVDDVYVNVAGDIMEGDLDLGGNKITNLGAPTVAGDAVPKSYVDNLSAGLDVKAAVRAATTETIVGTYDNGDDGVGATITSGSDGAIVVDGVSLNVGDRVLVKDQTNSFENGVYVVSDAGSEESQFVLTRAEDFDGAPSNEIDGGEFVFVKEGSTQADTGWLVTEPDGVIDVGTDPIVWTQFSGASSVSIRFQGDTGETEIHSSQTLEIAGGTAISTQITGSTLTIDVLTDGETITVEDNALEVADGGISDAKLRPSAGLSVIGNAEENPGNVADITATEPNQVLRVNDDGDTLEFGAISLESSNSVTGVLPVENGGTGQSSFTEGYIVSDGTELTSSATIDAEDLSGVVAVENGGTGLSDIGDENTLLGVNADGDALEYKTIVGGDGITVNHTDDEIEISASLPTNIQYIFDSEEADAVAAQTYTITHGLGQRFVNVTVYSKEEVPSMIIPQAVELTSENVTTVTFNTAVHCYVVIMGVAGVVPGNGGL